MHLKAGEHRMQHDSHGLALGTDSAAAARAFDHAVAGYIGYRADAGQRLAPLLARDPHFALAHCLKGYLTMLTYKQANVPLAAVSLQEARHYAVPRHNVNRRTSPRWPPGSMANRIAPARYGNKSLRRIRATQGFVAIPRDALALRLAHFTDFWLGRPDRMLTAVRIALPLCEAVLAHGQGQPARAVALVRPVLGEMYRLGGSHAQQDVLEQLYLHAAVRAGLDGDARLLLERVAGRHTMPPHRRIGYRAAAPKRLGF
jgi:hypothetical protein